jgi:heme a synthase
MKKQFRKITKITLVLIYLVIIAGATVRMTGSGMGCPDWPKCFGYYIPPTEESQLVWQPHKTYKKGQVIIVNESLRVAKSNFKTTSHYDPNNWDTYAKHNYAIFNPYHTWMEFINRLIGALAGLSTLIMAIISLRFWKEKKTITILAWIAVFGMGFQAWLGAVVVYSVLAPIKITLHMAAALGIVALILYILYLTRKKQTHYKATPQFKRLLIIAFIVTVIQIVLGTQVRQFIDEQLKITGEYAKHLWLQNPSVSFYIHRSFSIVVVALNLFLALQNKMKNLGYYSIYWILLLLGLEALTGIVMNYAHFPLGSQAAHLVIAALLFGMQFYLLLNTKKMLLKN